MSRVSSAAGGTVKVAVAAFATAWLEPHLQVWLPKVPEGFLFLLGAAASAAILQILLTFVVGWSGVSVVWTTVSDRTPITQLNLRFRGTPASTEQFVLSIHGPDLGLLSYWYLCTIVKKGLVLQIGIDTAPITAVPQSGSTGPQQVDLFWENNLNGLDFSMTTIPSGLWRYANVSFQSPAGRADFPHTVQYHWLVGGNRSRFAEWVLRIHSDILKVRVTGDN